MKRLTFGLLALVCLLACKKEDNTPTVYPANQIHNIPQGGSGSIAPGDYSGDGTITNVANTSVTVIGTVTVDGLAINGKFFVPKGATLIVNDVVNVGGGTFIDVEGTLITKTFTQVGNTYLKDGSIQVSGKYTLGGGTTLYIENAKVKTQEMIITGHIQAIENDHTKASNVYSLVELSGVKYLNRGGGTDVCGPVVFTGKDDQGSSGVKMSEVTSTVESKKSDFKTAHDLTTPDKLYMYEGTCTPLTGIPTH